MSTPLSRQSVADLRARYLEHDQPITPQLLARLERDPRKGVRQIHHVLKQRYAAEQAETQRLEAMLRLERTLWEAGLERVAGVDEAGMGCLAGPVVAAAVIFPPHTRIEAVHDSKQLDAETRGRLATQVRKTAMGIGVGLASVEEIDRLNVYHAGLLAMARAVKNLPIAPRHLLVDGRLIPGMTVTQSRFDHGDATVFSIAAASIIAKTHRDRLMARLGRRFPAYGFERNKGYGSHAHQAAIRRHGLCPLHRRSFPFLGELLGEASPAFYDFNVRLANEYAPVQLERIEAELESCRDELSSSEWRKLRALLARRRRQL